MFYVPGEPCNFFVSKDNKPQLAPIERYYIGHDSQTLKLCFLLHNGPKDEKVAKKHVLRTRHHGEPCNLLIFREEKPQ